jgi:hypothetical protein
MRPQETWKRHPKPERGEWAKDFWLHYFLLKRPSSE